MFLRRHSPCLRFFTGLYPVCLIILLGLGQAVSAQSPEDESLEDSTVIFEAEFFEQFQPVSVNDMIDRILAEFIDLVRISVV